MISIIIPTYNEEKAIGNTLKHLVTELSKSAIPYEIIVTDDKSTDKTIEVARSVAYSAQKTPGGVSTPYPITILAHETKHFSIAQNRNAGAKVAHGDYFVFMDSDCVIENMNESLAHAVYLFEKSDKENKNYREKLVGITGAIRVLPEYETWGDKIVYIGFNLVHRIKTNTLRLDEASGKFQMMRRDAFFKVNGYREDLITREDGDMFWRLSKIGRNYYDPTIVVRHTGRRAHQIGWPKLLSIWMFETFYVMMFNKSYTKSWKDIR